MKIGELAKHTGLTASRIRFYETCGLLPLAGRRGNGYREYGPEVLWMLEIISTAQSAGFSLEEIRGLLPDSQASWQHDALLESLQRKVTEIEKLQERLALNKSQLLTTIETLKNRPEDLACSERPQWVLSQLRNHTPASTR